MTPSELDALPVGSRFVDPADGNDEEYVWTKCADGSWFSMFDSIPCQDGEGLQSAYGRYAYQLDTPTTNPLREALAPFAAIAAETPDDIADDFVLIEHHFLRVTVGDCRRALLAMEQTK